MIHDLRSSVVHFQHKSLILFPEMASPSIGNVSLNLNIDIVKFSTTWVLREFSKLEAHVNLQLEMTSPEFTIMSEEIPSEWSLAIGPVHPKTDQNDPSLSFHITGIPKFEYKLKFNSVICTYVFYIVSSAGAKLNIYKSPLIEFLGINGVTGSCKEFIKFSELERRGQELVPNDELTLGCDLTIFNGTSTATESCISGPNVVDNLTLTLGGMLDNNTFSDVALQVGKRKFKAHKVILAARSSVFAAMFLNDMVESRENLVIIDDIEPNVFEMLLQYMYTGKPPPFSNVKTALDVLYAADKYLLDDLKNACQFALSHAPTIANITEVILIAVKNNLPHLKRVCIHYINRYGLRIIQTPEWKKWVDQHQKLALELFHGIVEWTVDYEY